MTLSLNVSCCYCVPDELYGASPRTYVTTEGNMIALLFIGEDSSVPDPETFLVMLKRPVRNPSNVICDYSVLD